MCLSWITEQSSVEQKWNTDTQISFHNSLHFCVTMDHSWHPARTHHEKSMSVIYAYSLRSADDCITGPYPARETLKIDTDFTEWYITLSCTKDGKWYQNWLSPGLIVCVCRC